MSSEWLTTVGSSLTVLAGAATAGAFIWREMKRQSRRFAKAGDAMETANMLQQAGITSRLWDNIAVLHFYAGHIDYFTGAELQRIDGYIESHVHAVMDSVDLLTKDQKRRLALLEPAFVHRLGELNPESPVPRLFLELYEKLGQGPDAMRPS